MRDRHLLLFEGSPPFNQQLGRIISGGETELYRQFIVDTMIGKQLVQMYQEGVPIVGFSAGALISPETCVIPPIDNRKNEHLFLKGLGLIKDYVVSVHFSRWDEFIYWECHVE